jgi:hypothetical protein
MMDIDSPTLRLPAEDSSSLNERRAENELAGGDDDASQSNSTLSRLLTEVITSAVLDSLNQPFEEGERHGQEATRLDEEQHEDEEEDDDDEEEEERESQGEEGSSNRTFQLPRELFPSVERSSSSSELGSFFRMLRMPASTFRSSNSSNNQTGETMPVFIIGYRATRSRSRANQEEGGEEEEEDEEQQQGQQGRRWVIYIISGSHNGGGQQQHNDFPASLFSDNPSYEDLMMLSHFLGPVRPVTATAQQIETIPITIYRKDQMTEMINDKCQVCLEDYAESQELRMLQCKHGFHKDCIDRWLTEGRNCCPICRGVPVPHADDG